MTHKLVVSNETITVPALPGTLRKL